MNGRFRKWSLMEVEQMRCWYAHNILATCYKYEDCIGSLRQVSSSFMSPDWSLGPLSLLWSAYTLLARRTTFTFTKENKRGSSADDWYIANDIETAEHGGTHIDAPYHFHPLHWKVGDIPIDRFFGTGIYIIYM